MIAELQQKRWDWQEDRRNDVWHGSEKTITMYFASTDMKPAFDAAGPRHNAKIMEEHNIYGCRFFYGRWSLCKGKQLSNTSKADLCAAEVTPRVQTVQHWYSRGIIEQFF